MAYFYDASQGAHEQITALFDFVWPTATAMWNLRWQVNGYLQIMPNADIKTLEGRFTEGSRIRGANLKRACLEYTWEQQQERFAQILLFNTFAIYEGWVAEVLTELNESTKNNEKGLQFSSMPARSATPAIPATAETPEVAAKPSRSATAGALGVVRTLTSNESQTMKSCFYHKLIANKRYDLSKFDNQMRCFRYFKELRNSLMHANGAATEQAVEAYDYFKQIATTDDLGVNEVPEHAAFVLGLKPMLSLRGVVGFSDIVLRIITTLDAELSRCKAAEKSFIKRWKKCHRYSQMLPGAEFNRHDRVSRFAVKAGFPKPQNLTALIDFVKANNLFIF